MLLMGDEVRRTQHGNNNAYCQDNEISWFDWRLVERHADVHRFVKLLNAFRQRRDVVAAGIEAEPQPTPAAGEDSVERRRRSTAPDWSEHSHSLAITLESLRGRFLLHGIFNAYWEPLAFELPPSNGQSLAPLHRHGAALARRHLALERGGPGDHDRYVVAPRSVVVFALGLRTDRSRAIAS